MQELTSRERVDNTLRNKPIDRVATDDSFWGDTRKHWIETGQIKEDDDIRELLGLDFMSSWCLHCVADIDFEPVVLEETEETILQLDGNGATLRTHKLHAGTPEHVDFLVKERPAWEEKIKPFLMEMNPKRLNIEGYRQEKEKAAEKQKFFTYSGVLPFEQMHPICGHEYMLMGMALDPDWVKDMVMTYANFIIMHLEHLFAEAGKPDGVFFYEDMGFKNKPFMSPDMYRDIIQPGHKKVFDFVHSFDLPIIVHSCGFVRDLVPGLVEAGMDCLQAMEVKAGMDMREIKAMPEVGKKIAYFGNMDVRELCSNDLDRVDKMLEEKLPAILADDGRYILMSDHSIPPDVNLATMQHFLEKGRAMSAEIFAKK